MLVGQEKLIVILWGFIKLASHQRTNICCGQNLEANDLITTAPRISNKELMRYKHTCTYLARLGTAVIGTLTISHAGPIWSSASRGAQKWCLQFGPPEKWPGPSRHLQSSRFPGVPCAWNFPEKREKGSAKASWDWCKENYVIVVALYWLCIS